MPAVSEKQREAIAIAEHHPGKLSKRNRAMKKMTRKQQHEFAATKGLKRKGKKKGPRRVKSAGHGTAKR